MGKIIFQVKIAQGNIYRQLFCFGFPLNYYYFLRILSILTTFLFWFSKDLLFSFFPVKNTKYFNTYTHRKKKVLKKLTVVYIQKRLILEYTVHALNFFNSHLFFNVELNDCLLFIYLFIFRILSILTHIYEENGENLKEINSGV